MKDQPTVEQSLHSIALSMIEINKELRETRYIQTKVHRFHKQETRWLRNTPSAPKKRRLWDWLGNWASV